MTKEKSGKHAHMGFTYDFSTRGHGSTYHTILHTPCGGLGLFLLFMKEKNKEAAYKQESLEWIKSNITNTQFVRFRWRGVVMFVALMAPFNFW
jgi:hypothetical protein